MFNAIMERLGYEKRADSSYTDALVAVLTSGAAGTSTALPTATAALESCAGLVGRSLSPRARYTGLKAWSKALTPDLLSMVGRALIRRGEILFSVDVTDGRLRLLARRLARYCQVTMTPPRGSTGSTLPGRIIRPQLKTCLRTTLFM